MWIAIGVIGGTVIINTVTILFVLLRLREAEMLMVVLTSFVIGQETNAGIAAYLKSRSDHPAGKKGVRQLRRVDDKGTT